MLDDDFPLLRDAGYEITSPATPAYNCIAWALGNSDAWWWPDPLSTSYWPSEAPCAESVPAFTAAFAALGFLPCADDRLEDGFDKLALYAKDGVPTHAARQRLDGRWTSKLGVLQDITHSLDSLTGSSYGAIVAFFRRESSVAKIAPTQQ